MADNPGDNKPNKEDVLRQFFVIENKKAEVELQKVQLAFQKQKDNTEIAKISITSQKEIFLKDKVQKRYTICLYAAIGIAATGALFLAGKYLLDNNHKDILVKLIEFIVYIGSIYIAYRLGVKKGRDMEDDFEETQ